MTRPRAGVLVVARAGAATEAILDRLRAAGMRVGWARDDDAARRALADERFEALLVALRAPRIDGMALLREVAARPNGPCVVVTHDAANAGRTVEALRAGAWDALPRTAGPERVLIAIERGIAHRWLRLGVATFDEGPAFPAVDDPFAGGSRAIERVAEQVRQLGPGQAVVLVEGEPGTGKGAVARAIHRHGPRRHGPFVTIDVVRTGPLALERELFGEASSAAGARPGGIERAEGGTLYLAGIVAAPASVQARLLHLLQERAYERVGGTGTLRADVRVIAGTDRDLEGPVREGAFREDLARRLGAARIVLPPLRDRLEDLPALVERCLREANRRHRRKVRSVTRGVLERLQRHDWPGNLRQLAATIESMVVVSPGGRPLDLADLPSALKVEGGRRRRPEIAPGMTVEEVERTLIAATLEHVHGDKPRAAAMLGIGLRTLYRKIQRYDLT